MSFSSPLASVFRRAFGACRRRVASPLAVLFFAATPFFAFAQPGSPTPPAPPRPQPAPKRPASVDWALEVAKFLTSSPQPPAPPTPPQPPRPDAPPRPPKPPKPVQATPKTLPRPESAAFIARVASLRRFEDDLAVFFQQTSDVAFRPLTAMRATPFGGAVKALDLDAPAGLFLFFDAESPRAQAAFVLPVDDFGAFVGALGGNAKRPDAAGCVQTKRPFDALAKPVDGGFVALARPKDGAVLARFAAPKPSAPRPGGPRRERPNAVAPPSAPVAELSPGLVEPTLIFEATPRGLLEATEHNRPFWRELAASAPPELAPLFSPDVNAGTDADALRERFRSEIASIRCDVSLDDFGAFVSFQTEPRPGSAAARRLASLPPAAPIDLNADRFFFVLPDAEAPLSGQFDLAPALVSELPKPFDRLRRVEYSLALPRQGELAAESWLFYLEVDDSQAFVRELTVPKAQEIGRYVGAKQAAELGAELFGALAARRQDRQLARRRPPRNPADPEAAAARGEALGALIGGLIGESAGEKEALKEFEIDGYRTYISDLETYVRQSAIMRADREGRIPPKPLDGGSFSSLTGALLAGIENGDLEDRLRYAMLSSANADARFADPTPLFARRSIAVVLDERRLLISLGNDVFLRMALQNWRSETEPGRRRAYKTTVPDVDFSVNLNRLAAKLPPREAFNVVGAVRFDAADAQTFAAWLRVNYFPNLPDFNARPLPPDTPQALWIWSFTKERNFVRGVVPNRTLANVSRAFFDGATPLELLTRPRLAAPAAASASVEGGDEEIDFEFE
ncbi:MAG: hypothetical protein J6K25_04005 [Thermoguttaceae bacterium]|nr:hypothetical protein [Thermoguttaceae bacterium]